MLIPLNKLHIEGRVKGVVHIGAHECEERGAYLSTFGLTDDKIVWIDALKSKVDAMKSRNKYLKIFNACVSDVDGQEVEFMVTNNYQSSSILNLKTHLTEHPHVREIDRIKMKTVTLDTLFRENGLNFTDYDFLNIDIQGAELMALKGATEVLKSIRYIYLEVNEKELYDGCALLPEVDSFLKNLGFSRKDMIMTQHGWGDAFYSR